MLPRQRRTFLRIGKGERQIIDPDPAHETAQDLASLRRVAGHRQILEELTNVGIVSRHACAALPS